MATKKRGNNAGRSTAKRSSRPNSTARRRVQEEEFDYSLKSELVVIAMVILTIFLFLCNFGICGAFGNAVSSVLFGMFGFTAYFAPLVALGAVAIGIANFGSSASKRKIISGIVLFFIIGMVADLLVGRPQSLESYSIVDIYKEKTGDSNIYTKMFKDQLEEDGRVVDYHPTVVTHEKVSEILKATISEILGL